jgi:hypothetical protein
VVAVLRFDSTASPQSETVVWPDAPDREQWWRRTLGIDSGVHECDTADFIEQQQEVPLDDDLYPATPHASPAAA